VDIIFGWNNFAGMDEIVDGNCISSSIVFLAWGMHWQILKAEKLNGEKQLIRQK
jgi:hypothetical protein